MTRGVVLPFPSSRTRLVTDTLDNATYVNGHYKTGREYTMASRHCHTCDSVEHWGVCNLKRGHVQQLRQVDIANAVHE